MGWDIGHPQVKFDCNGFRGLRRGLLIADRVVCTSKLLAGRRAWMEAAVEQVNRRHGAEENMGVIPIELQGFENWLGCIIGLALGLVVLGDAQEYFVHLFETLSQRTKINYDPNPLHHLDPWSIPIIILAGWGWSRRRVEAPAYFPPSTALRCFIPVAGPIACFALIGILATFYMFLPLAFFKTAIAINIQIAMANLLIPIPPLAVGRALCCFLGRRPGILSTVESVGAVILLGLVILDHTLQWSLFAEWVMKPSAVILEWVLHQ